MNDQGRRVNGGRLLGWCAAFLLAVAAFATVAVTSAAAQAPTTIFLVRHAEKSAPTGDVPLSAEGHQRAVALAAMLRDAKVTAVFTSDTRRTRETASPLAQQLQLTPQTLPASDLPGLVAKLKALPVGSVALVVHHSNTVPQLVALLGAGPQTDIPDSEYDRLYIVTRQPGGAASLVRLRYQP